jgi:hypothetical protein
VIYLGQLDFTKAKDHGSKDGYKFTCNCMQIDFNALVAAYESTKFEIPLTDPDAILVELPGIQLEETCDFDIAIMSDFKSMAFLELNITTNEVHSVYPTCKSVPYTQQGTVDIPNSGSWFIKPNLTTKVRVQGFIQASVDSGHFQLNIYDQTGAIVKTLADVILTESTQVNFEFDFTETMHLGDAWTLYCINLLMPTETDHGFQINNPSQMTLTYNTISPPTKHKMFRVADVYKKLLNKIYETAYPGITSILSRSIYLKNSWNNLCITSGDAFRTTLEDITSIDPGDAMTPGQYYTVTNAPGFYNSTVIYNGVTYNTGDVIYCIPAAQIFSTADNGILVTADSPATIKTSWKDFFESINAVCNVGFGVEAGVPVLENKSYFYRNTLLAADVGNVEKFELSPEGTYIFNTIKGGYPDQTYDVLSGRAEVNSEVEYSTMQSKMKSELNLRSVYRADPYGIEFMRIKAGSQSITKGDNEVFFVVINDSPETGKVYYRPKFDTTATGPGVSYGIGYYNTDISPKKNLLRHADYLKGILYKVEGQIKLTEAKKNTGLVTVDDTGTRIAEADPLDIGHLADNYFINKSCVISTKSPVALLSAISNFPTGYIAFVTDGTPLMGFMLSVEVDPAKNTERSMKLLLTSKNDLSKLVR